MSQPRLPGRCALSPLPTQLQGPLHLQSHLTEAALRVSGRACPHPPLPGPCPRPTLISGGWESGSQKRAVCQLPVEVKPPTAFTLDEMSLQTG